MKWAPLLLLLLLFSCEEQELLNISKDPNSDESIQKETWTVDPKIKSEVLQYAEKPINSGAMESAIPNVYPNTLFLTYCENDTPLFSTFSLQKKDLFKSWYSFKGDTLEIEGAFGLFGSFGFFIQLVNEKVSVYHMLSADDSPYYSYTPEGPIRMRLEVPCRSFRLVLSEIPNRESLPELFGRVEFVSEPYYSGASVSQVTRQSVQMKIYFRSRYFDLSKV